MHYDGSQAKSAMFRQFRPLSCSYGARNSKTMLVQWMPWNASTAALCWKTKRPDPTFHKLWLWNVSAESWKIKNGINEVNLNLLPPDPPRGVSMGGDWSDHLPLKPTKITLFTMMLYNLESSIRDIRTLCRPLFVTAVLWSIVHPSYRSEGLWDLTTQFYWNRPPNHTGSPHGPTFPFAKIYCTCQQLCFSKQCI